MPRKPRICFEGAFYHVTARGDNKERIFSNNWDRKKLFGLIRETKKRFDFILHCYVLMRNHFHLLIETGRTGTISEIMHYINSNYTRYFNKAHKRNGHLFQGRFHDSMIDRDAYLLEVSRYIHLNPVRAGIVKRPEDYKWSSYLYYIGREKDQIVCKDLVLNTITEDSASQAEFYMKFVNEGLNKDFDNFKYKLYHGLLAPK